MRPPSSHPRETVRCHLYSQWSGPTCLSAHPDNSPQVIPHDGPDLWGALPHGPSRTYLQWTTMGPAWAGLRAFTFFRNFSIPMGVKGTPKSGQLVKCSWETSRGALQPSGSCCGAQGDT